MASATTVMAPLVSIVVITHNRSSHLRRCLQSVLLQGYSPVELVVVDNASIDDTPEVVANVCPLAQYLRLEENRGVSGGRNAGFAAAQGEFCLAIDDDAILCDPGAVAACVERLQSEPQLAVLAFTILLGDQQVEDPKSIPRRDKRPPNTDYECSYFCGAGFAIRREAYFAAGGFWEPLVYGSQELDLSYRLLDLGWRLEHSRRVVVRHFEAVTGRPRGQWVYYNARDRFWVAVRNLPWPQVATTALLWWAETAWTAVRCRQLSHFFRGFFAGWRGLRRAWSGRRVMSAPARRRLGPLSGRLWY